MKKLLVASMLVLGITTAAFAEGEQAAAPESSVKLDEAFQKANTWLSKENLALTGGASGRDDNAAFAQEAILFYGEGMAAARFTHPTQRELMAKEASKAVAYRQLVEYLEGFALVGDTLVKDGMAESSVIRTSVAGFVKGAQIVMQEFNKERDSAVTIVKLGLHGPKGFASTMYEKMLKDPKISKTLTEIDGKPAKPFKAAPETLSEKYDGLIIDATSVTFRPALINRIFTPKNELLYDPSKISQKVLVEQGCGEYTNTVDKAKAALEKRGVTNPIIVTAASAVGSSDLQVSDEDAVKIFSANQKGNFMGSAKVAFVLK